MQPSFAELEKVLGAQQAALAGGNYDAAAALADRAAELAAQCANLTGAVEPEVLARIARLQRTVMLTAAGRRKEAAEELSRVSSARRLAAAYKGSQSKALSSLDLRRI